MNEQLKKIKGKNVKFIRLVFVDILGRMLDFAVSVEEYESLIKDGRGFDGSSVEGFARIEESDLIFIPDIKTLIILPWEYRGLEKEWKEAMFFGKIFNLNREEYAGDTRVLLKNVLKKNEDIGILKCGAELEFFIFENNKYPSNTDQGGYFRSGLYAPTPLVMEKRQESVL